MPQNTNGAFVCNYDWFTVSTVDPAPATTVEFNVHVTNPNRFGWRTVLVGLERHPTLQSRVRCYAHVSIPLYLSSHDCPSWRHRLADSGYRIIINRTWSVHGTLSSLLSQRIQTWSVNGTLSSLLCRLHSGSVFGSICPSDTYEREQCIKVQVKVGLYSHERVSCWLYRDHLCAHFTLHGYSVKRWAADTNSVPNAEASSALNHWTINWPDNAACCPVTIMDGVTPVSMFAAACSPSIIKITQQANLLGQADGRVMSFSNTDASAQRCRCVADDRWRLGRARFPSNGKPPATIPRPTVIHDLMYWCRLCSTWRSIDAPALLYRSLRSPLLRASSLEMLLASRLERSPCQNWDERRRSRSCRGSTFDQGVWS